MSHCTERDRASTPSVAAKEVDAAFTLNVPVRPGREARQKFNHHYGKIFAVSDVPPVDVTVLIRRNRARCRSRCALLPSSR